MDTELSPRPYGPHTWIVCSACNYNNHRCFFCGDDLTHAEAVNGTHPCYFLDDDGCPND